MPTTLSFPERIAALILINECQVGDRNFLSMIKLAKAELHLTEKDTKEFALIPRQGGGIDWDNEKAKKVQKFDIPESVLQYFKDRLKQLDSEKKLHMDLLPLADKMLGGTKKKG